MKNDRVNYVLVGAFVVAMVAGLIVAVAALTGRTGATDTYYTSYPDATGLSHGTRVLYMGYPVGQVDAVRPVFEDGSVEFELELSIVEDFAGWKVPEDSVAQVRASGLLAALTIDIRAGSAAGTLRPGDRIRGIGRTDVFGAVSDTANVMRELVLGDVKPLVENLNRYVSTVGDVLERRGAPLIENLSVLAAELASRAPGMIEDFLTTTHEFRAVSRRIEHTLSEENAAKAGSVIENVLSASEDMARLAENARGQLAAILDDGFTGRARRIVDNVDAAAATLATASATARDGLDTLLAPQSVARVERAAANLELASAGARDLLGGARIAQVDSMLASSGRAAANLDQLIAEVQGQVRGLLNERTVGRFDAALENISTAAATVARLSDHVDRRVDDVLTPQMAARMREALENFARAAASVASLTRGLERSRADLDALLGALRGVADENRAGIRESVTDLRYSLDVVARHVDAVAQNLEGSSRNMLEFSRRLKSNPGLLLRGRSPAPDPGGVR